MKTVMKENVQYIIEDSKLDSYIKNGFKEVISAVKAVDDTKADDKKAEVKKEAEEKPEKPKKLKDMTRDELLVIAEEFELEFADGLTDAELIALIKETQKEAKK